MTISVIMSVYNKGNYLDRSVSSVLNQKYKEFELICVDGGSTDHSLEILGLFSDSRLIIYPQDNLGISAAKNFGVSASKYDLITFIDADDEWNSNFLSEIIFLYNTYPDCSAFITGYYLDYGSHKNKVLVDNLDEHGILPNYFARRLTGWGVHTSSVALKKSIFNRVGGFPVLIGSQNLPKSYIIDCSGKFIADCTNLLTRSANWKKDKFNVVPKAQFKDQSFDLFVAVPGLCGEDQYLHDMIALDFSYAFSKKILSTWYGNIPNQDTKQPNKLSMQPHLIGLSERFKKSRNHSIDLYRYLLYLDESLLRFISLENRFVFTVILNLHSYFERHWIADRFRDSNLLKSILISLDIILRAKRKISRIALKFFC